MPRLPLLQLVTLQQTQLFGAADTSATVARFCRADTLRATNGAFGDTLAALSRSDCAAF